MIILYSKSCAFVWVADFWCRTVGSANLDTFTVFHRWGLCLTIIGGSFTRGGGGGGGGGGGRGGIYPNLMIPITYFLYHFNQPCEFVRHCPYKTWEKFNFSKNGKTVISIENLEFF